MPLSAAFRLSALCLGFAMAGFFDGIVLHQILQWHHLLSAWADRGAGTASLRFQVLADGMFHAAMYAVAVMGVVLLVRARQWPGAGTAHMWWGRWWVGFGSWHAVDAVLSHWVLGLHRIRMDSPTPLAWDLAWLGLFGLVPLVAGWWLQRPRVRPPGRASRAAGRLGSGGLVVVGWWLVGLLTAGTWSAWPPAGGGQTVLVVLRPGAAPGAFLQALGTAPVRIVATDAAHAVWMLHWPDTVSRASARGAERHWYRAGALYVSGGWLAAGCAAWFTAVRNASLRVDGPPPRPPA